MHQLSVSWHIIPLKFSNWSITLQTKEAHHITNFQIFECFNESSPNSSYQFLNHKVKVYSNFVSLFSVTKDNSSVFFLSQTLYSGQKEPIEVKFSDFWVFGWKFTKVLLAYLKLQVSFSLNFPSLFSVMRDNSSLLFKLKLYMIWAKGAHQSARFQTFDCSHKASPNVYFDRLLSLKVYKNFS